MTWGVERMTWATGRVGTGVEVVGFGVGDGGCAEEGQDGERGPGEGGLAVEMAQNGQSGSVT